MMVSYKLQVGGTLNPRKHLYIERTEDEHIFQLLFEGEYVNILSSRQMGKSSLVMRLMGRLQNGDQTTASIQTAYVDLAAKLGKITDHNAYYQGLLKAIVDSFALEIDIASFWHKHQVETPNQKLMRFFRVLVDEKLNGPCVIFLDEIDSSLSLSFTDDLFTAIRGMYNERPIIDLYERITFCLIGVATPDELIKGRRTTPYNVGHTIELRDFDQERDDLSAFSQAINPDLTTGQHMLQHVLGWTGGHPYLTAKLCAELHQHDVSSVSDVDEYITEVFYSLDQVSNDTHFQQILRFIDSRLTDALATFNLYTRLLDGKQEQDQTAFAHLELKLSGLAKRDDKGCLVIRNQIYRRLFNEKWAKDKQKQSLDETTALKRSRRRGWVTLAASVLVAVMITVWLADEHNRAKMTFAIGLYPLIEPQMADVPAGTFQMDDLSGKGQKDELPVHTVVFEKPFKVGVNEVSFDEYDQFALLTGRELPYDQGWGRGKRPLINVSWDDAKAYTDWLSEQTAKSYRLLTEAEWEYAARAGSKTPRFWEELVTDELDPACRYANVYDRKNRDMLIQNYSFLKDYKSFNCDDPYPFTAPVGSFEPNDWGLNDMLGNVWEWVKDCYVDSYKGVSAEDPALESSSCDKRVLRGGSWGSFPGGLRSGARYRPFSDLRNNDIGFRVMCSGPL